MNKIYTLLMVGLVLWAGEVAADDILIDTQDTAVATNLGLYGSHTWDIAVDPIDNSYVYIATYRHHIPKPD